MPQWATEFDLGEFLAIGLDTTQIAHLAGALFLGLFGLSAVRRAKRAEGVLPAVWLAVAVALFAGTLLVAARGFPDYLPDWLRPWTDLNRLARVTAVLALLGCSLTLLSGHWVRDTLGRFVCRVGGLALAALAVWLATGWFVDDVPDEVKPWTAQTVLVRVVVVLGLVSLAAAFWFREATGKPHARWANRVLMPAALGLAVVLAWRWFGSAFGPDVTEAPVVRVTAVLVAVATATFLLIAVGAYAMRDRPEPRKAEEKPIPVPPRSVLPSPSRPLPVAILIDDHGRPVLPPSVHPGPAGS